MNTSPGMTEVSTLVLDSTELWKLFSDGILSVTFMTSYAQTPMWHLSIAFMTSYAQTPMSHLSIAIMTSYAHTNLTLVIYDKLCSDTNLSITFDFMHLLWIIKFICIDDKFLLQCILGALNTDSLSCVHFLRALCSGQKQLHLSR